MVSPAALASRTGNVERSGIIVREVWQTTEETRPVKGDCMLGLIARCEDGVWYRPACTGQNCQH